MLRTLRLLIRELLNPIGRFRLKYAIVRNWPGESGFRLRQRILRKQFKAAGEDIRIHEGVRIRNPQNIVLGNGVTLGVDNFIQAAGGLEIGDMTLFGPGVKIWTQNHAFADASSSVRDQGAQYKKVIIGRDVWVGANAFIMPGAEIGDGCVVSACAVVGGKKVPPYSILAGNPARTIGKREEQATTEG